MNPQQQPYPPQPHLPQIYPPPQYPPQQYPGQHYPGPGRQAGTGNPLAVTGLLLVGLGVVIAALGLWNVFGVSPFVLFGSATLVNAIGLALAVAAMSKARSGRAGGVGLAGAAVGAGTVGAAFTLLFLLYFSGVL
ncbi:hypothetical protein ACOBQX_13145 [Actinokineospora sp. G85]|uniref:hypothetical protein n=1 Tax=Actinokineospora sp. G85 TaxID=3406626 RepID=UPI003C76E4AD